MKFRCILLLLIVVITPFRSQTYLSSNINLVGFIDPETVQGTDNIKYSGCWGYNQTSKNKEYAIVGSSTGTYFIDITAPATPTVCDYVKGTHPNPCIWREVNVYQNYAYVISDDPTPNSFQIIDMQYLPDSVHVVYDDKTAYFERGHTLTVDGNKLYVAGITLAGGSTVNMRVYSLATPSVPVLLRTLSDDYSFVSYVHDMHVHNDTVFAACAYQGLQVFRLTGSNTFSILGSLGTYPESGYNHSSSLTQDGKSLVFCDEIPTDISIKLADVSNLSNITVSALFRPNLNSGFVGHNPYVIGNDWAFASCYEDGLYLYNISNPSSPVMAGYFDTYPQGGASFGNNYGSGSYNGNWGAYPYFKSGYILACDMQNGVFILEAFGLLGTSTGLNEKSDADKIMMSAYPNPASTLLDLAVKDNRQAPYKIELRNLQGQVLLSQEEPNAQGGTFIHRKLDVSGFAAGLYLLSVSSGKESCLRKITISR
ncbi:MAG: choice-of-anchor B family protein [Bacteroidia bacterium]